MACFLVFSPGSFVEGSIFINNDFDISYDWCVSLSKFYSDSKQDQLLFYMTAEMRIQILKHNNIYIVLSYAYYWKETRYI